MHSLPDEIRETVEQLTEYLSLKKEYGQLSGRYREGMHKNLQNPKEHLAYLACRLPATYAVNVEVLRRFVGIAPQFRPESVLDVGSGPATSLLALLQFFPDIARATLVERDQEFVRLAKRLLGTGALECLLDCSWQEALPKAGHVDLVISSYMLSELPESGVAAYLEGMMALTSGYIILIDTGTPFGYQRLMLARDLFLEHKFFIHAPCPHQKACPMPWCHFSVRLPRSHLHRQVKGAERGFEDEKFCYLIASKERPGDNQESRIVRLPLKRSGHVHMSLCTPQGELLETIVSKKMGEQYQIAKKANWGDTISA